MPRLLLVLSVWCVQYAKAYVIRESADFNGDLQQLFGHRRIRQAAPVLRHNLPIGAKLPAGFVKASDTSGGPTLSFLGQPPSRQLGELKQVSGANQQPPPQLPSKSVDGPQPILGPPNSGPPNSGPTGGPPTPSIGQEPPPDPGNGPQTPPGFGPRPQPPPGLGPFNGAQPQQPLPPDAFNPNGGPPENVPPGGFGQGPPPGQFQPNPNFQPSPGQFQPGQFQPGPNQGPPGLGLQPPPGQFQPIPDQPPPNGPPPNFSSQAGQAPVDVANAVGSAAQTPQNPFSILGS